MLLKMAIDRNSIRTQILLLVCGAVFVTVALVLTYAGHQNYVAISKAHVREASTTADLLAQNCIVAVSFGDAAAATDLIRSLEINRNVRGAVILDADGSPFAAYGEFESPDHGYNVDAFHERRDSGFVSDHALLQVGVPLTEMNERIGTLITVTDTSDVQASFRSFVISQLLVLAVVFAVVLTLSVRILNSIIRPVIELTAVAREVSESENYALRASATSRSEIGTLCRQFNDMLSQIESANAQLTTAKEELYRVNENLERRVAERTRELEEANGRLTSEFRAKEAAYAELKEVQSQLVESSRAAGMAEIANGVLHNIGNVLNSVKVAASVASDKVSDLRITPIHRTADLLKDKQQTLGPDWTEFEGLQHVPRLLEEIGKSLETGRSATLEELRELDQNVLFIEEIVRSQQSYARKPGLRESVLSTEVFDTALKLVNSGNKFPDVEIVRNYESSIRISIDKNRVLQILSNFIKNGFEAMLEMEPHARTLQLTTSETQPGWIRFSVRDSGHGIAEDTLAKLFTYGFTTKPAGHGFGLHSAACAAREMNGMIHIESDGPGCGACFSLDLPAGHESQATTSDQGETGLRAV